MRSEEAAEAAAAGVAVAERGSAGPLIIPDSLTVKELADLMEVTPVEVIKELIKNGVMATINQVIDEIEKRCRERNLRLMVDETRAVLDFTVFIAVQTMHYLHSGQHRVWL